MVYSALEALPLVAFDNDHRRNGLAGSLVRPHPLSNTTDADSLSW